MGFRRLLFCVGPGAHAALASHDQRASEIRVDPLQLGDAFRVCHLDLRSRQ